MLGLKTTRLKMPSLLKLKSGALEMIAIAQTIESQSTIKGVNRNFFSNLNPRKRITGKSR
jgi:hypothetical protein